MESASCVPIEAIPAWLSKRIQLKREIYSNMETATQVQLKASELRIGSYVLVDNKISKVISVTDSFKYQTVVALNDRLYQGETDFFEPIPLTPDLLAKCGFEKISNGEYRHAEVAFFFCGYEGEYAFCTQDGDDINMRIKYLHQLQNLYFALTGEELEINL